MRLQIWLHKEQCSTNEQIKRMSIAGVRSNRGDAYQRAVALHYCVRMIVGDDIKSIQVDSIALPGEDYVIYGDDIVALKANDDKEFCQAKINEKNHSAWSLANETLAQALSEAKSQLLAEPKSLFYLYSRTPFGPLQRLIEEIRLYHTCNDFSRLAPQNQKNTLNGLAQTWQLDELQTFQLAGRLRIGSHHSTEEWEEHSQDKLNQYFSNPNTVSELIYSYVDKQHRKLGDPKYLIDRDSVLDYLRGHGCYLCNDFNENITVDEIKRFSLSGRQWNRTIGGVKIERTEVEQLKKYIEAETKSVLLTDDAGGGKTCILLDLMDFLDSREEITALYIRGDLHSKNRIDQRFREARIVSRPSC